MTKAYVEEETLKLPNVKDGPGAIGDLWNCHNSESVGFNLFGKNLQADHLIADPRQAQIYTLTHVKETKDKTKTISVSAEVSLELMGGLISVSGFAEYDENKETNALDEELCCNYHMETFSVRSLPSAKEVMDPLVAEKLLKGEIKATHVVSKIILGGEVTASIILKTRDSKSSQKIKGGFMGKLILGPVSATAKATLGLLDTDVGHGLDKRITISAKPPIKTSPESIKDMFATIDSIYGNISAEKHFPQLSTNDKVIIGVPIRFHLVPITQYLDIKVEMLYLTIKDTIMDEFKEMLMTLKDLQLPEFIKKRILDKDGRIELFLSDQSNEYTKKITELEVNMSKKAGNYFFKATQLLKEYKVGQKTMEDISVLTKEFNTEFDLVEIYQISIQEYVTEGKRLLVGAGIPEIEEQEKIKILTNETDLQDWFGGERGIKILLKTQAGGSVAGSFRLYEIGQQLGKLDISVAVAVPNISNEFSLTLKIRDKSTVYKDAEIPFALRVISAFVDPSEKASRFFKICANISGLHFTSSDYLASLPSLISLLRRNFDFFQVTENYLELLDAVMVEDDEFKFVLTIETLYSSYEAVRKALEFNENFPKGKWILGNFEIEGENDAPLLFVFRNGKLVCTLFDGLDFLTFAQLYQNNDDTNFEILEKWNENLTKNFIHPEKCNFMTIVKTTLKGQKRVTSNGSAMSLKYGRDDLVLDALEILGSWLSFDSFQLLKTSLDILKAHHKDIYEVTTAANLFDNFGKVSVNSENLLQWSNFLTALKSQVEPFLIEIDANLEILNEKSEADEKNIELVIKSLTESSKCPNSLKETLGAKPSSSFEKEELTRILTNAKNELLSQSGKYRLNSIIQIVDNYITNEKNSKREGVKIFGILNAFIEKLLPGKSWPENWKDTLVQDLRQNKFYSVLNFMAPFRYDSKLTQIQSQVDEISNLTDVKGISKFLVNLTLLELDEMELQALFSCKVFLHYLSHGMDDYLMMTSLRDLICPEKVIPNYIPKELKEKLKEIMNPNEITLSSEFSSLSDALKKFRQIIQANILPENFRVILLSSLKNEEFLNDMKACGGLFYYNADQNMFEQPWDVDTVRKSKEKIEIMLERRESEKHKIEYDQVQFEMSASTHDNADETTNSGSDNNLEFVTMQKFVQVNPLIAKPEFDEDENVTLEQIMPYIIQKIKMWGVHAIQPEHIASFFRKKVRGPEPGATKKGKFTFKSKAQATNVADNEAKTEDGPKINKDISSLSRVDILTYLANSCETIVFQDILRIISQFPVALPLILNRSLTSSGNKYILLQDLLKIASFKWESGSGIVQTNQLFKNNFKIIVALRMSGPTVASGPVGKSTILNQLMSTKNAFSSKSEPCSERGKSKFQDGTVEFLPLTQETCNSSFYEQVLRGHYESETNNQLILLANLHGNAATLLELLQEIQPLISSYIVFFPRQTYEELEENYSKIGDVIDLDLAEVFLVDPFDTCVEVVESEMKIIETGKLLDDFTLEKLRISFRECLNRPESSQCELRPANNLIQVTKIETAESQEFINFIQSKSCAHIKDVMKIQKPEYQKRKITKELYSLWRNSSDLRKVIQLFANCLFLPISSRNMALIHIDREISALSSKDSEKCRRELLELKEAQSRIINLEDPASAAKQRSQLMLRTKLKYEELDRISLGMEHFYREIGRIYEISLLNQHFPGNQMVQNLPGQFAELLIQGHALEILDGDLGDINERWFTAVCEQVGKRIPTEAKIFVVSILGLQSSGKSTLLNSLFGCKFAVSTGRCTKGLFMRLLLLDETLKKDLGVDMILIIDTEGLGAPEKMNDPGNEQNDRLMATFAMSFSNLTLINVLGESLRDLTEILQIVIVTMARLEEAQISPDILMVQHLQERDKSKTLGGSEEFIKAIDEAIKVTDTKNVTDFGIKSSKGLQKLIQRVQDGRILQQFRSFKSGATLNSPPSKEYHEDVQKLFETILASCREMKNPLKFRTWVDLMPKYWNSVSDQNFALRFKNVKELCAFLERGNKIAHIKEIFNEALHAHKEECAVSIRNQVQKFGSISKKNPNDWKLRKEKLLKDLVGIVTSLPYCHSGRDNGPCVQCINYEKVKEELLKDVENSDAELETKTTVSSFENERKDSMKKQLTQFLSAQEVQNGISSDFDSIIDEILREKLKIKKIYTDSERNAMVEDVWSILRTKVSGMNNVAPVKRRIITEARGIYKNYKLIKNIESGGNRADSLPNFVEIKARDVNILRKYIKGVKEYFDFQHKTNLESALEEITNKLVQDSKSKFFEDGMVRKLHQSTKTVIEAFEKNGEFLPEFTWAINEYALKFFIIVMESKESEWNRANNPITILMMKENEFKKNINVRLQYGFTFDGEGRILGEKLIQALNKIGIKSSNKAHRDIILGHTWMINSGNVRLEYFKELVCEVRAGNKAQALKHFDDPRTQIRKWFSAKVDSFSTVEAKKAFTKTVAYEFDSILQSVSEKTEGIEIKNLAEDIFSKVDGVDYRTQLDLTNVQPTDLKVFKSSIIGELEQWKRWLLEGQGWTMERASDNPEIMSRLGCIEHCYWCGALCWGQFGHDKNADGTKKHHTCHQPKGLIAECYTGLSPKGILIAKKCDEVDLNSNQGWSLTDPAARYTHHGVRDYKCMRWRDAMVHDDFKQWTFTAHPQTEFNDLMKWFFSSLQGDIANAKNVNTAFPHEFNQLGFQNLSIDSILSTIQQKIGS